MTKSTHPLQTKAWGKFRRAWGNEILETPYGTLTLHRLPFTNYKIGMLIRGGEPTQKMLEELKKIAKDNNLVFIKLEPNVQKDSKLIKLLKRNGAITGKTLFTPSTFQIDLTKSEEELLNSFHSKTRYNIRYAQRQGVEVVEDNSDKAFETYLKLMRETVERQRFYAHSEKYHRLMWEYLRKAKIAHLLVAKHKNKINTAWILFKSKDTLYYPYGASTFENKNLQANSAMMWEAIKFGKKHKLKYFDLWGREEGKGFTHFKEGFNPQVIEFIGTWDLVINKPLYYIYRLADYARWRVLRIKSKFTTPRF